MPKYSITELHKPGDYLLNDGSTDSSLALWKHTPARGGRIVIIDKEKWGYGATCNRGITAAHGSWVVLLSPDDYLEPTTIQELVDLIQANGGESQVDIARSAYWRVFGNRKMAVREQSRSLELLPALPSTEFPAHKGRVKPKQQPCSIDQMAQLLLHHPAIWTALYRKGILDPEPSPQRSPWCRLGGQPFLIACIAAELAWCTETLRSTTIARMAMQKPLPLRKRQPKIPLERWNDMMDVMDERNITLGRGTQRAHATRQNQLRAATKIAYLARRT